ncbi:transcription termination factor Rho [Candidatus Daviesbacteria bacterium RIFCSPHIGHO2_02_FULL_36_13]|uniref:Transcription termination factor Rho n=1 Tax=Candidatus Daviesbacteria bacterium RIFCSPHIGHO2_02_FULL_36_13 TaxID=1797768 RepID=A0A1F5JUR6_9BACT|nr:MAG: transcription termination factor Rho [Candidatus Daviesbacteria bacterium RIFCSPHIGHO2_02_FULL_36_13]
MPRVTKSFRPAFPVPPPSASPVEDSSGEQQPPASEQAPVQGGFRPRYGNGGGYQNPAYAPQQERDVPTEEVTGVLEIMPEGHGFLRPKYIPSDMDVYISNSQIRRFWLRAGDLVDGAARPPKETERYFGLLQVNKINGEDANKMVGEDGRPKKRVKFEDLTAIYPNKHLKLETGKAPLSQRVIDLVSPIGFGQRGLIVSPPKAGKTTILKDIASGIAKNHPDVILMAVLVGERPEEVTDLSRSIKGDVIASNFDEPAEEQTAAAEIALERAKRLVEMGKDVVILLDSITRLGRAYNLSVPPSGRTLSGGFDPIALYPPKHFFGAARNCEQGGSLTIIGTALVDTGSRMDDLIYEEFKGTGNMELHLDRRIAERRVFPAIDIEGSGTRQEQLLFKEEYYKQMIIMRRMIGILGENERTEIFLDRLAKTESNEEFLGNLKDVR